MASEEENKEEKKPWPSVICPVCGKNHGEPGAYCQAAPEKKKNDGHHYPREKN